MAEKTTANFKAYELRCKCPKCNRNVEHKLNDEALDALQRIRTKFGKPIALISAYRCANHPVEARKEKPGTHYRGTAFDLSVPYGRDRFQLLKLAIEEGFNGLGFGDDMLHIDYKRPHGSTWKY